MTEHAYRRSQNQNRPKQLKKIGLRSILQASICKLVAESECQNAPLNEILLSGVNRCAYVGAEGDSYGVSVTKFAPVWQSFVNVNTRYTEAKQRYEAYTIEEVVEKLFG